MPTVLTFGEQRGIKAWQRSRSWRSFGRTNLLNERTVGWFARMWQGCHFPVRSYAAERRRRQRARSANLVACRQRNRALGGGPLTQRSEPRTLAIDHLHPRRCPRRCGSHPRVGVQPGDRVLHHVAVSAEQLRQAVDDRACTSVQNSTSPAASAGQVTGDVFGDGLIQHRLLLGRPATSVEHASSASCSGTMRPVCRKPCGSWCDSMAAPIADGPGPPSRRRRSATPGPIVTVGERLPPPQPVGVGERR